VKMADMLASAIRNFYSPLNHGKHVIQKQSC